MKNLLKTSLSLLLLFLLSNSFAQTANLSIQGVLRNSNGTAVENGKYDLTFRLYTETIPDTLVWEDTMEEVDVEGGIYSVTLGAGDKELDAAFDKPYTLGISIEGGTELIPRAKLTSSPYALSLIGDDNIFPNSGNVGVGADAPQHKLTVQRGDGVLGLEAVEGANNVSTITTTTDGMTFDAGGTDKVYSFSNGRIDATADEQLTIEGTNDAQLIFTKASGSATLGFDPTNGDTLMLTNSIGATKIEGNNITLNTSSGTATIEGNTIIEGSTTMNGNTITNGNVEVNKEGETLKLVGETNTQLAFYPTEIVGGKKADIGIDSEGQLLINATDSDIVLTPASGERVQTKGMLYATGEESVYVSKYNHIYERYASTYATRQNARNYTLSIYATKGVHANFFVITSDKRIKKDISQSDGQRDLSTLSKIEVTDYRHIDEIARGKEKRKGVIAQQVETVFPEAITKSSNFIPNVFDFPSRLSLENGNLKIRLNKNHDFEAGDKIKIGTLNGNREVVVADISSPHEFSIDDWSGSTKKEELFVYGKEVDDFHTVDYDRIFTLNVSATQELARKVEVLEKENARLSLSNKKHLQSNHTLKTKVEKMSTRLENIESLLNTTSSN